MKYIALQHYPHILKAVIKITVASKHHYEAYNTEFPYCSKKSCLSKIHLASLCFTLLFRILLVTFQQTAE